MQFFLRMKAEPTLSNPNLQLFIGTYRYDFIYYALLNIEFNVYSYVLLISYFFFIVSHVIQLNNSFIFHGFNYTVKHISSMDWVAGFSLQRKRIYKCVLSNILLGLFSTYFYCTADKHQLIAINYTSISLTAHSNSNFSCR